MPDGTTRELLGAVRDLSDKVGKLSTNLTVVDEQMKRVQKLTRDLRIEQRVARVLVAITILGLVMTAVLIVNVRHATDENHQSAVASCRNSNNFREQNLKLWVYLLNSTVSANNLTAKQKSYYRDLTAWITALFTARDCEDLGKVVHIPDPPDVHRLK